MKLRNINGFEQHAEKLALAATGLVLVFAIYYYVLGEPNTVTINNEQATPDEVDHIIAQEAERLERRLRNETPEELANIVIAPYTADFVGRRTETPVPDTRLATNIGARPLFPGEDPVPGSRSPFHVPQVPTVPIIAARSDIGTVADAELEENRSLARFLAAQGDEPSPDMAWVSLVGAFDLLDMVQELSYQENGVSRRVPERWWSQDFAIVDVQVERQELLADGTWGSPEPVQPLPGEDRFGDLSGDLDPERVEEVVAEAQSEQIDIIQRPFYTLVNRAWSPPDPEADADLPLGRIRELRSEIETLDRRIERMEQALERQVASEAQRPRIQQQQRTQPQRPRGGGDGRGRPPAQPQQQQQPVVNQPSAADRMREQLGRRMQERHELQVELAELLGQEPPAAPRLPRGGGGATGGGNRGPGGGGVYGPGGGANYQQGPPAGALQSPYGAGGPPGGGADYQQGPPAGALQNPYGSGGPPGGGADYQQGPPAGALQNPYGGSTPGGQTGGSSGGSRPQSITRFERDPIDAEMDAELEAMRMQSFGAISAEYIRERFVDIWAHDIHVEEGKTYRYRMRVGVLNPLYDRGPSLPEEQREQLNDQFLLYSDWSDWSQPYEVESLRHFFFVDGSQNGVEAEVWRYTSGEWFQREFRVAPGDPIGRLATIQDEETGEFAVDFFTGAYVIDIDPNYPIAGTNRSTQRVFYAVEGAGEQGDVDARVVDNDRETLKREWLRIQRDLANGGLSMR